MYFWMQLQAIDLFGGVSTAGGLVLPSDSDQNE
jgi:hypothetical protein